MTQQDPSQGLNSDEVEQRQKNFGSNTLPDTSLHPLLLVISKFWAPVPWMLEAAICLQLFLGEYIEASIVFFLLIFNAALGFFQETHAQATLSALKSRLALTASVLRSGLWKTINASELVPGDIIKLSLGDIVAADVRLIEGSVLLDQSMLTGESLPVEIGTGTETFTGALVQRGEAIAEVTAIGIHTKFGKTAELVRTAHVTSSEQKMVLHVVRNLALVNGVLIIIMLFYAVSHKMSLQEIVLLGLTSVLASIPVALPATFTLAATFGAQSLARQNVLPTRLSALDEAATMDLLCVDKTGTLTQNVLSVTSIHPLNHIDSAQLLGMAMLASSKGAHDPIDQAIHHAASHHNEVLLPQLLKFTPFDPETKMAEATVRTTDGQILHIVKGAVSVILNLTEPSSEISLAAEQLEAKGFRVLAVAAGETKPLHLLGLIALSDLPRNDSASLIKILQNLGLHIVMVTGDAATTAATIAHTVGLTGKIAPPGFLTNKENFAITQQVALEKGDEQLQNFKPSLEDFSVFAGVLPEDKYHLVKAFQKHGHTVGMCGDGVNDAPALRQAQIGIAVATATDVAKSAAGVVLINEGLSGIVAAVKEGRIIFQRIITYTISSINKKIVQVLFLMVGLFITGHAILTPLLMVIIMITGDFLGMALTVDHVNPSPKPNSLNIRSMTLAGIFMGFSELLFCLLVLIIGKFYFNFTIVTLQTLAFVSIVFGNQASLYVIRARQRLWSAPYPSGWLFFSSFIDLFITIFLASQGILMTPLSLLMIAAIFAGSLLFALVVDSFKIFMPLLDEF